MARQPQQIQEVPQYEPEGVSGYNPNSFQPGMKTNISYNQDGDMQTNDLSEQYGSIIKDLTDTDLILETFELRLMGRFKDKDGKIKPIKGVEPYIKNESAAKEFADMVRGFVNRHNDFSYYNDVEINDYMMGSITVINRWLMLQGSDVPLRYREKISFQALCLINASLHKANGGKMLVWTKGTFREGLNISADPRQKKGNFLTNMFGIK